MRAVVVGGVVGMACAFARDGAASTRRSRQLVEETRPYLRSPIVADDAIPAGRAGFRPAWIATLDPARFGR